MITLGGLCTIASIVLIMGFLLAVALPLFSSAEVQGGALVARPAPARALRTELDEYGQLAAVLDERWVLTLFALDSGATLARSSPLAQLPAPSAWALHGDRGILGFDDGTLRELRLGFTSRVLAASEADPELLELAPGASRAWGDGLVTATEQGLLRHVRYELSVGEALPTGDERPVRLVDAVLSERTSAYVTLQGERSLTLHTLRSRRNLLTGERTRVRSSKPLPLQPGDAEQAWGLFLMGHGDTVLLTARDGRALRLRAGAAGESLRAEQLDLAPEPGATLTSCALLAGRNTLVTGDSEGRVSAWFSVHRTPEQGGGADGRQLVQAHALAGPRGASVASLAPSRRSRLLGMAWADGQVRLQLVTSGRELVQLQGPAPAAGASLALAPREDALGLLGPDGLQRWRLDPGYPEAGLAALFTPLWYEGLSEPDHLWQSTGGSDAFEPKLGLWPLVFGTIKATVYCMLFGAPLALLAALFTSEFMPRRRRTAVKTLIELMASLPSVVLGFLAGLVLAPFIAEVLPEIVAWLLVLPACLVLGAALWSGLPRALADRHEGLLRLGAMGLALLAALGLSALLGGLAERLFFGGDVMLWLDGAGEATGGWLLLLLPACGLAFAELWQRVGPGLERARLGPVPLAAALGSAGAIALAFGLARLLDGAGFDLRGSLLGPYEVRNALVVGFAMGFAVIPVIYTLAEDALGRVPEHLRHASLAAGATRWQTAFRVVVPAAASGVFSALMIGLGRAVGETMIVLMATGNTPIRDWNLFNGFRTLSANIAVELPEAVQGGAHYRTLFLAGLVLFAMTFVLNTGAEWVRARARRKLGSL